MHIEDYFVTARKKLVPNKEWVWNILHDSTFCQRMLVLTSSTHHCFYENPLHDLILAQYLHGIDFSSLLHANLSVKSKIAILPQTPLQRIPFQWSSRVRSHFQWVWDFPAWLFFQPKPPRLWVSSVQKWRAMDSLDFGNTLTAEDVHPMVKMKMCSSDLFGSSASFRIICFLA